MTRRSIQLVCGFIFGGGLTFLGGLVVGTRIAGPSKRAMTISMVSSIEQNSQMLFQERSSLARKAIEQHLEILESERAAIGDTQYRVGRAAALVRLAIELDSTDGDGKGSWQKASAACVEAGFCKCSQEELRDRWGRHKR